MSPDTPIVTLGLSDTGPDDLDRALRALTARCPAMARAARACGPLRARVRDDGFAAVLSVIMGQQVSVASAAAVWARLEAAGLTTPQAVAAATPEDLRTCGLSRQKVRYAHALARSGIDYAQLRHAPDAKVIGTLTEVPGVGRWTAEIYLMFSLRRADVFAAGDLALQEAVRILDDLEARPTEAALRARAQDWAPWRTVAATLLWQYYACVKSREGVR